MINDCAEKISKEPSDRENKKAKRQEALRLLNECADKVSKESSLIERTEENTIITGKSTEVSSGTMAKYVNINSDYLRKIEAKAKAIGWTLEEWLDWMEWSARTGRFFRGG